MTQSLRWQAPNSVVAEAVDATGAAGRAVSVTFIPSAVYAPGVDAATPGATEAFQIAQQWLTEHAFTLPVPSDAQTLSDDRAVELDEAGSPPRVALEQQAIAATSSGLSSAIGEGLPELEADLAAYLADQEIGPSLIVIEVSSGV
ncbi:hypothetical protein SAMN06295885_3191 [Rathayibacter oskolensis]|uniref:Uncharacterized protein n=1 Tax=Rathayibacter oskolensis TaxID=1891671 RepID=A0A1X7PCM8_9MICO|nr:hypothetical protein [Rathayibacter oskolensis]SMH49025.1 hypothetical protein SAMN06295885_3191 [Rathayibacter oskolensis]